MLKSNEVDEFLKKLEATSKEADQLSEADTFDVQDYERFTRIKERANFAIFALKELGRTLS